MAKRIGIIGGGIAGLALSIDLSMKGYSVTVFEKNTLPNHKVCGEYVSAESSPYLTHLGVFSNMKDCPRITRLQVSSPKGKVFNTEMAVGGIGISRYKFDYLLWKRAEDVYVHMVFEEVIHAEDQGSSTIIRTKKGNEFQVDLCVGAYGKRSNMDLMWNRKFALKAKNRLNQWVGIKYHIKYSGIDSSTIALHNFESGYCGISKVEGNTTCLCYLVSSSVMKDRTIQQLEEEILMKNPFLNQIFKEAKHLYLKPLAISQISFDKKSTSLGKVVFVGDAAGLVAPLSGNGMSLALRTSKLLTEHIDSGQFYHEYRKAWNEQVARRLWWGRAIQRGFGNPSVTELLIATCRAFPSLGNYLVAKSHGEEF